MVKALFEEVMSKMEEQVGPAVFRRWLLPLKGHVRTDETLTIQVPNIFFKTWLTDHYLPALEKTASEVSGRDLKINFVCARSGKNETRPAKAGNEPGPGGEPEDPVSALINPGLNKQYNFANFIVGNCNQLAYAASQAVANLSPSYNPLFIYGGSGLGKTHLLNAIGNQILTLYPKLLVVYMTTEQFTNELIEALRTEKMSVFRQKYRYIDALLIDDIHFIGGKERTQEEFFYTFNALFGADKQIILSSDKMPKEIPDLEARLRSRFEGGLFADITPPDRETKVAILSKKAEEENIDLNSEVAFYLASQNETNIRVLEGYLARLGAYSSLFGKPINLETAEKLLGMFIEEERRLITVDHIQKTTAGFFNIRVSDLKSSRKQKAVAMPRQAAMFLARKLTSLSTAEIGLRFGGRDHSTVVHAVKRVENLRDNDHNYSRTISDLEKAVQDSAARMEYSAKS